MKKGVLASVGLVFTVLASTSAHSQVLFQPRVIAGFLDYEISVDSNLDQVLGSRILASEILGGESGSSVATNISDTFAVLGLGLTAIKGKYFADVYFQDSISGGFSDQDSFANLPLDQASSQIGSGEIDRQDFALSFGHSFDNGISLSGGYKSGVTEFSQVATLLGEGFTTSYEFDITGPFAAIAYGGKIGKGVLGVNVAIADLSADYNFGLAFFQFDQASIDLGAIQRESLTGAIGGDATAVTVGVSWKAPLPWARDERLSYTLSLDTYDYDIDLAGGSQQLVGGNQTQLDVAAPVNLSANFNEQATSFKIAIQYLF